ncbi:hypothetical protein DFH11DRAFT_1624152, partial [Phellopilus nigrolimitatus]
RTNTKYASPHARSVASVRAAPQAWYANSIFDLRPRSLLAPTPKRQNRARAPVSGANREIGDTRGPPHLRLQIVCLCVSRCSYARIRTRRCAAVPTRGRLARWMNGWKNPALWSRFGGRRWWKRAWCQTELSMHAYIRGRAEPHPSLCAAVLCEFRLNTLIADRVAAQPKPRPRRWNMRKRRWQRGAGRHEY